MFDAQRLTHPNMAMTPFVGEKVSSGLPAAQVHVLAIQRLMTVSTDGFSDQIGASNRVASFSTVSERASEGFHALLGPAGVMP